jgi:hypothetical protein
MKIADLGELDVHLGEAATLIASLGVVAQNDNVLCWGQAADTEHCSAFDIACTRTLIIQLVPNYQFSPEVTVKCIHIKASREKF